MALNLWAEVAPFLKRPIEDLPADGLGFRSCRSWRNVEAAEGVISGFRKRWLLLSREFLEVEQEARSGLGRRRMRYSP